MGVVAAEKLEAPAGLRDVVRDAARRFKSSWVEFGKLLVQVRDEGLFDQWGYATFEAYCSKELHIRKATADKLVRSFGFLSRHEPHVVEQVQPEAAFEAPAQKVPAFEVVEVLAGAEARGQLSAEEYRSIRDSIWDEERPVAQVKKELDGRFPKPPPEPPGEAAQLKRMASMAAKLAAELKAHPKVNKAVAERAAALAEDVEELAAQVRGS